MLLTIVVYLLHWLYRRPSKDQSFMRTGVEGALVVPKVRDITVVNMNAVLIEIRRLGSSR